MALDEQGKGYAKDLLKFFWKSFKGFLTNISKDVKQIRSNKQINGKVDVNKLVKDGKNLDATLPANEALTMAICNELKKYKVAYAVVPHGVNEKTNEEEFKITYMLKDAPVIESALKAAQDKMVNPNITPKRSLKNILDRKPPQKALNRSQPLKHKEVGAR